MHQALKRGFVQVDGLCITPIAGEYLIKGRIECQGNIFIEVNKAVTVLEKGDDPVVQTTGYAYHAMIDGHGMLLRYDNAEHFADHPDAHHRHVGNWRNTEDHAGMVEHVGESAWPTLSEFVLMIETWYYEHLAELSDGPPE